MNIARRNSSKALNSPIAMQGSIDAFSIRPLIAKALGDIHPENDLLFIHSRMLMSEGGRHLAEQKEAIAYLRSVVEWAKKEYGISPTDPFDEKTIIWRRPVRP